MSLSQPGIYNVLDYGMVSGSGGSGTSNATSLQTAINTAESDGGGIILIPSDDNSNHGAVYNMEPPSGQDYCVSISGNYPLLILGTGGATTLMMLSSGDVFQMPTGSNFGGTSLTFQDLYVVYNQLTESPLAGTAFNLANSQNARLFRVYVQDCQYAVNFFNVLQGSISDSTLTYTDAYPTSLGTTCVTIGAPGAENGSNQVDIDACVLSIAVSALSSIGLLITKVDGLRVHNTQIAGFYTGIRCAPPGSANCTDMWFNAVEVAALNYGAYIQPQTSNAGISNLNFSHCSFQYVGN